MYNYLEAMVDDIKEIFYEYTWRADTRDELEDEMNDRLWNCDYVTGNESGSYTCNTSLAKEYVLDNVELFKDACDDFCIEPNELVKHFFNEDWEWADCIIRCYLLSEAISKFLDEHYTKEEEDND